uniref:Centrosomal protein POC5 n=1 Tax=Trypanosoma vivax (strain Y486) TaxID=1055687 RepID=G0U736_TRYVY|nr:conserved hypothetical protein [Trypanosoma vivax Y486]
MSMLEEEVTQCDELVVDVGNTIDTHTVRMREDILSLLAASFREHVKNLRVSLEANIANREQTLLKEKLKVETTLSDSRQREKEERERVVYLIEQLAEMRQRLWLQRRFREWESWIARKRHRWSIQQAIECSRHIRQAYHVYTQWRLLAAARRHHAFTRDEELHWKCREAELLTRVEVLEVIVEQEKRRNAGLEDKMRTAFVRGVCALNREAVQVLKGGEGADGFGSGLLREEEGPSGINSNQSGHTSRGTFVMKGVGARHPEGVAKNTVAAVEEERATTAKCGFYEGEVMEMEEQQYNLSGSIPTNTHGRSLHPRQQHNEELREETNLQRQRALPPSFHICYAPNVCAYNVANAARKPFVISVDPKSVRCVGDVPTPKKTANVTRKALWSTSPRST